MRLQAAPPLYKLLAGAPHPRVGLLRPSPLVRQRHRIVLPPMPSSAAAGGHAEGEDDEYQHYKELNPLTDTFLDRAGAETLRRQRQLRHLRDATDATTEQLWRDSKPHLRKQRELVQRLGVDGAVQEMLSPTKTSFREQLRQRPLDRRILEEIYTGLHGRRIERRLKKGVSWEHWITKGDGTAPVFNTSAKAQQTFAFGGSVRLLRAASHPLYFPCLSAGGALRSSQQVQQAAAAADRQRARRTGTAPAAARRSTPPRDTLVPEVAFIGRTSGGKSSLVNALVNAMVSPYGHLQGTTNSLRFYSVANKMVVVDCPGYGFYNPLATPAVDAENAVKAMRAYLKTGARNTAQRATKQKPAATSSSSRSSAAAGGDGETEEANGRTYSSDVRGSRRAHGAPDALYRSLDYPVRNIKRVFVCVPAHGMQHLDHNYCRMLNDFGIPFSVVLTKTDAAPIRFLARLADYTRCQLVQYPCCKELMLTSALRLAGVDKLQNLIGGMALTEDALHGASPNFDSIV